MRRGRLIVVAAGCVLVAAGWSFARHAPATASVPRGALASSTPAASPGPDGHALYLGSCAMCHGADGGGTKNGRSLRHAGTASVDFMLRTGRMPLPSPKSKLERHTPKFDDAQIRAIVDYTATFTDGPAVPNLDMLHGDLSDGSRLYQAQCAACHQSAGAGGALAYGDAAPSLHLATNTEVAEAVRTGPGQMPKFSPGTLSDRKVADIAAYVHYLHHPDDRGGINLGHLGPVPEGFIAWTLGLGVLILVTGRLGERTRERDQPSEK